MHYVYILKCSDDKLYVGQTANLKERFERHQKGYVPSTKGRRPVQLSIILLSQISTKQSNLKNI